MQRRAEPRDCREARGLVGQRPERREKACPLNSGLVTGLHGLSPAHSNGAKHTHNPMVSAAPPDSAATFLAALAIFLVSYRTPGLDGFWDSLMPAARRLRLDRSQLCAAGLLSVGPQEVSLN